MDEKFPETARNIMEERFGCDCLIALATVEGDIPAVRAVNAYYENGVFYVITDTRSNKMKAISNNPAVAICGDWFTAQGIGEDLGYVLDEDNLAVMSKLRAVFAEWYDNGHIDEQDPNTHLLCIHLTRGVLHSHGTRYAIDFGYAGN